MIETNEQLQDALKILGSVDTAERRKAALDLCDVNYRKPGLDFKGVFGVLTNSAISDSDAEVRQNAIVAISRAAKEGIKIPDFTLLALENIRKNKSEEGEVRAEASRVVGICLTSIEPKEFTLSAIAILGSLNPKIRASAQLLATRDEQIRKPTTLKA